MKNADLAIPILPKPEDLGWKFEKQFPDAIIELNISQCKTGCTTMRCKCCSRCVTVKRENTEDGDHLWSLRECDILNVSNKNVYFTDLCLFHSSPWKLRVL